MDIDEEKAHDHASSCQFSSHSSDHPVLLTESMLNNEVEQPEFELHKEEVKSSSEIVQVETNFDQTDKPGGTPVPTNSAESNLDVPNSNRTKIVVCEEESDLEDEVGESLPLFLSEGLPTQSELDIPLVFTKSEEYVLAKTRSGRVGSIVATHHGTDGINAKFLFKPEQTNQKPEMRPSGSLARINLMTVRNV